MSNSNNNQRNSQNHSPPSDTSSNSNSSSSSNNNNGNINFDVDKFLNESLLKPSTRLFEFYSSSSRNKNNKNSFMSNNFDNFNWNALCSPLVATNNSSASTSSSASTANNNNVDPLSLPSSTVSSMWLSSIDYLKNINLIDLALSSSTAIDPTSTANGGYGRSTSTTTSSSSGTTKSSSQDIWNLSSQLILENRLVASVTKKVEDKIMNFLSQKANGIVLGAVVGAAVATGVIIGMMAAASFISSNYMPLLYQNIKRRCWQKQTTTTKSLPPSTNDQKFGNGNDNSGSSSSKIHVIEKTKISGTSDEQQQQSQSQFSNNDILLCNSTVSHGPLVIVQGQPAVTSLQQFALVKPNQKHEVVQEQCKSCLHSINNGLNRNDMSWNDLRRLTVYLVSGKCTAPAFRENFEEYTTTINVTRRHEPLITILYVQQLEDGNAILQIEAVASKS